jgi:hypothetical protein
MTLSVSFDLKNARLSAVVAFLDTGAGVARVRIYPGARPLVSAPPDAGFLAELPLLKPSGSVMDCILTLAPGSPVLNANSGVAAWARVVNGNGETAFDGDVTDTAGAGEIKIQSTVLYEGGETRMVSGTLAG